MIKAQNWVALNNCECFTGPATEPITLWSRSCCFVLNISEKKKHRWPEKCRIQKIVDWQRLDYNCQCDLEIAGGMSVRSKLRNIPNLIRSFRSHATAFFPIKSLLKSWSQPEVPHPINCWLTTPWLQVSIWSRNSRTDISKEQITQHSESYKEL